MTGAEVSRGPKVKTLQDTFRNLIRPGNVSFVVTVMVLMGERSVTDTVGHPSVPSPDPRSIPIDGQAIEPAVQYVQKMKQRCDPETYRQFLDIRSPIRSMR